MKIKKNGFVATSLIYSFFLVFIALIGALLSSYMANKTILDRYNEEIQKDLNTETYSMTVTTTNANIQDGITLTNLVTNGDFTNGVNFWNSGGNARVSQTIWNGKRALQKDNRYVGYYYQNINVLKNSKYYYSIEYGNTSSNRVYSYMDSPENGAALSNINASDWSRSSNQYVSTIDGSINFVLGYYPYYMSGYTYFTNVMIINLTASFGSGYEPNVSWVDENVEWFDGTISYIKKSNIASNNSVTIRISPYINYYKYNTYCYDQNGASVPPSKIHMTLESDPSNANIKYGVFSIDNVSSNIKCNIDWSV